MNSATPTPSEPTPRGPAATQQVIETEQRAEPRSVLILGSTGSIGTQALDVIRANPGRFRVTGLAAGGSDPGALAAQTSAAPV